MNELAASPTSSPAPTTCATSSRPCRGLEDEDGKAFPDGQHVAFTHWSVGGAGAGPTPAKQVGVWQYCSAVSGAALNDFMLKYPYTDSPEPDGDVRRDRPGPLPASARRAAIVSGYFNPLHIGHLDMMEAAREPAPTRSW